MTSGDGAEEVVESICGVTENYIERHEESAELFSILTYILGGLSLLGLWTSIKQKAFSNIVNIAILIFAFVVIYFGKETGTSGGKSDTQKSDRIIKFQPQITRMKTKMTTRKVLLTFCRINETPPNQHTPDAAVRVNHPPMETLGLFRRSDRQTDV